MHDIYSMSPFPGERILIISNGKSMCFTDNSTVPTLPKQSKWSKCPRVTEQLLIVDDERQIRFTDNLPLKSTRQPSTTTAFRQISAQSQIPALDRYLQDISTNAILYREQVILLFRQTAVSRVVPKKIRITDNHSKFIGASSHSNLINSLLDLGPAGLFTLNVIIERAKKRLSIEMAQVEMTSRGTSDESSGDDEEEEEDEPKLLDKQLSKTAHSLSKLYRVLDCHNAAQPRPWTLPENQGDTNSITCSRIISGTLLDKKCSHRDFCNIRILFKDYRLGNAKKAPHKPRITVIMEH